MHCPRCEHDTPASSRFCTQCGARLTLFCGSCGAELVEASASASGAAAPRMRSPTGQSRFASPEAYTPRHLAERILTSKSALEGERKQVTVVFADLQSSLELLADRDPARLALEEAADIARDIGLRPLLGRCHLALGEALHRAGEPEGDRRHLEQAAALFREMDMRFWLGRADAALSS
jgi:Double zinc ribbon